MRFHIPFFQKRNKVIRNAGWIICGRAINMLCGFIVSVLTTKYLGPNNYGAISYALAYVTFFYSLSTLGINSVLVKALIDEPDQEGTIIGTTIVLQWLASLVSAIIIIFIVSIIDRGEKTTIIIVMLCSTGLLFKMFDCLRFWFQAHLLSKYSAIATSVAYIATTLYRTILLMAGASVFWFAIATAVDYAALSILLLYYYKKNQGPQRVFNIEKAKKILKMGAPFILAGMMVSIYGNTDKIMLKQMTNNEAVAYYALAISLSNAWVFILSAIIDSIIPVIMCKHKTNEQEYELYNRLLYFIVFYISAVFSIIFLLLGKFFITALYGIDYLPATVPLQIISWYVAFSYIGVARNAWIVSEGLQKYVLHIYFGAAISNIILNYVFIPKWDVSGAAVASLFTQISTIFIFPLMIKRMRKNVLLILDAIFIKDINFFLAKIRQEI